VIRSAGRPPRRRVGPVPLLVSLAMAGSVLVPLGPGRVSGEAGPDHLVISEIVTGGTSASDEFIEIYNPSATSLPVEGLELVYVSASGLTVSRRAAWDAGAPELPAGRHLLVANELGGYAGIADALYASGMAATGGSVALRIQGGSSAIDALGWGTASSDWLEGMPAPAPAAGGSLERLPGGLLGSTRDTDDNASDFAERVVPDPQNSESPPTPDPSAPSPIPTPTATPTPTTPPSGSPSSSPTPSPTATASPAPAVSVATARSAPNGTRVTVEATALTGSIFTDGGGYVADTSGGIAVLLSSGGYERGERLRISGTVDDRFAQRTLRASGSEITRLGTGAEPEPLHRSTGSIGEAVEGILVRVAGRVTGAPTELSAGLAYELDDGSGPARVVVGSATGIATDAWTRGATVELIGVVGQRDSTGSGASGYRVQPRDADDILGVAAPTPAPSGSAPPGSGDPDPSAPPAEDLVTVAEARSLPKNARARVRGTVTMSPGVIDPVSAVIQDTTGAILLRVSDEVGPLARGDRVEVTGTRSTLAGMETIRVTAPAARLGTGAEPQPASIRTGDAGEDLEARLVRVRGALVATARRFASGTVSFEIDDGSGPLRVYVAAPLRAETTGLVAGAWVEATGILGQETTGAQPLRGYRVWPRTAAEVRVAAPPTGSSTDGSSSDAQSSDGATGVSGGAIATLGELDAADLATLHVGATLVQGPWPELDLAGLLWDGERLVAIAPRSRSVVRGLLDRARLPLPVELTGLVAMGTEPRTSVPMVALGTRAGDVAIRDGGGIHAAHSELPSDGASWVTVVGRLAGEAPELRLELAGGSVRVVIRCEADEPVPTGVVRLTGIGLAAPARMLVPCGGLLPAPALARTTVRAAGAEPVELPPGRVAAAGATGDLRWLAAGLLAAGALALATAGALARRLDPDPEPSSSAAEGRPPGDDEADAPVGPPALSLVSVPHERGSP
jgi:hypothetical protein